MFNYSVIKVPFVSAQDISAYLESLGLAVTFGGEYIEGRVATDNFSGVATGQSVYFVSGSGYWLASGVLSDMAKYLTDSFAGYQTGQLYQGAALTGNMSHANHVNLYGVFTGNLNNNDRFLSDIPTGYATGLYAGGFLTGNLMKSGYNYLAKTVTGNAYNYIGLYPDSGSLSGFWNVYDRQAVAPAYGYIANGMYSYSESYATYPFRPSHLLEDFTVETWVNPQYTGAGPGPIVYSNGLSSGFGLNIYGRAIFYIKSLPVTSSGSVPINQWTHLAVAREGNQVRIYFNGSVDTISGGILTGATTSVNALALGRPNGYDVLFTTNYTLTGNLDEFRLWNYARSTAEIAANYNTQIVPGASGLINYLTFN